MIAEKTSVAYLTVKASAEGVSEVSKGRILVFVNKAEIERIELSSGSGAENPVLQLVLGILLTALGASAVVPICLGNGLMLRYGLGFIFFGLVGVWMIFEALQKRTYLLVSTRKDRRKLFFKGKVDAKQLAEFLDAAQENFGYQIVTNRSDVLVG
ncbi:MAG: hypothetical protein JWR19_4295 [Pedosphaera sp.]|nr:hypothetical protein [Pedosphaera sp.]